MYICSSDYELKQKHLANANNVLPAWSTKSTKPMYYIHYMHAYIICNVMCTRVLNITYVSVKFTSLPFFKPIIAKVGGTHARIRLGVKEP